MEKIKFTADSTCDLTPEMLQEFDITLCPLVVNMGEVSELDNATIPDKIYAFAEKTKSTPKTAARGVAEYEEFFQKNLPAGGYLIHFNISSEISASHQNATNAAANLKNVFVIDSRSLSTGTSVLIMRAIKYRDAGMKATEIVERIKNEVNQVQCSFIVKDLTYLHRGGRCSSTAKLFASVLHLKPQIIMKNGKMSSGKKYVGNFDNCVRRYVTDTLNTYNNPDLEYCFITHTKMDNPQLVEEIKAQILAKYPFKHVIPTIAGGTVTSHCGPNTLGILYGLQ